MVDLLVLKNYQNKVAVSTPIPARELQQVTHLIKENHEWTSCRQKQLVKQLWLVKKKILQATTCTLAKCSINLME
jgi:hypothetical protein